MSRTLAYLLAAILALAEIAVLWLMLHPSAPPDYMAYYIERTTTCLNQPVPGTYDLGETVSFTSENYGPAGELRVCGWEGPAGDGTHAVGTSSRLRFALPPHHGRLTLTLAMTAVERDGHPRQRIEVTGNGLALGEIVLAGGDTGSFDLAVPGEAVAASPDALDVILSYPDAIRMAPSDADTRRRSIKLLSARLGPSWSGS